LFQSLSAETNSLSSFISVVIVNNDKRLVDRIDIMDFTTWTVVLSLSSLSYGNCGSDNGKTSTIAITGRP
jgi:hypothetical protein